MLEVIKRRHRAEVEQYNKILLNSELSMSRPQIEPKLSVQALDDLTDEKYDEFVASQLDAYAPRTVEESLRVKRELFLDVTVTTGNETKKERDFKYNRKIAEELATAGAKFSRRLSGKKSHNFSLARRGLQILAKSTKKDMVKRFSVLPLLVPLAAFVIPFLGDLFGTYISTKPHDEYVHPAELVDQFLADHALKTDQVTYEEFFEFVESGYNDYYKLSSRLHRQILEQLKDVAALVAPALEGNTPKVLLRSTEIKQIVQSIYERRRVYAQFDFRLTQSILVPDNNPETFRILTKIPVTTDEAYDLYKIITVPVYVANLPYLPLIVGEYFAVNQGQSKVAYIESWNACKYAFCPKPNLFWDSDQLPCGPAQFFNDSITKCALQPMREATAAIKTTSNGYALISLPPTMATTAFANCETTAKAGPDTRLRLRGLTALFVPPGCTLRLIKLGKTVHGGPTVEKLMLHYSPLTHKFVPILSLSYNLTKDTVEILYTKVQNNFNRLKTHFIMALTAVASVAVCIFACAMYYSYRAKTYVNTLKHRLQNRTNQIQKALYAKILGIAEAAGNRVVHFGEPRHPEPRHSAPGSPHAPKERYNLEPTEGDLFLTRRQDFPLRSTNFAQREREQPIERELKLTPKLIDRRSVALTESMAFSRPFSSNVVKQVGSPESISDGTTSFTPYIPTAPPVPRVELLKVNKLESDNLDESDSEDIYASLQDLKGLRNVNPIFDPKGKKVGAKYTLRESDVAVHPTPTGSIASGPLDLDLPPSRTPTPIPPPTFDQLIAIAGFKKGGRKIPPKIQPKTPKVAGVRRNPWPEAGTLTFKTAFPNAKVTYPPGFAPNSPPQSPKASWPPSPKKE
jgi:hypothetical protein